MKNRRSIYYLVVTLVFLVISLEYGCTIRTPIRGEAETGEKPEFYLVGMGPGDTDLITMRGLNAIKDADLIVCSKSAQERLLLPILKKRSCLTAVLIDCHAIMEKIALNLRKKSVKNAKSIQISEINSLKKSARL